ncbi:MAG: hypothetical protein JRJ86_21695 [Deltaproteobacteria bacterium]|nr:hypothetical protein [Deltaproteobacteria bacterium]MBW2032813.1 hypothetical protein [Deltaproteobacteria bacterium]
MDNKTTIIVDFQIYRETGLISKKIVKFGESGDETEFKIFEIRRPIS